MVPILSLTSCRTCYLPTSMDLPLHSRTSHTPTLPQPPAPSTPPPLQALFPTSVNLNTLFPQSSALFQVLFTGEEAFLFGGACSHLFLRVRHSLPRASTSLHRGQSYNYQYTRLYLVIIINGYHKHSQNKVEGKAARPNSTAHAHPTPSSGLPKTPTASLRRREGGLNSSLRRPLAVARLREAGQGLCDVRTPQSGRRHPRRPKPAGSPAVQRPCCYCLGPLLLSPGGERPRWVWGAAGGRAGTTSPFGLTSCGPRGLGSHSNGRRALASTGCGGQRGHCACAPGVGRAIAHPCACAVGLYSLPVTWNFWDLSAPFNFH